MERCSKCNQPADNPVHYVMGTTQIHRLADHWFSPPGTRAADASLYLIGSLRNPRVPEVAETLRGGGFDVFDDWYAAGEHADDSWRDYERARGHDVVDALKGYAAQHVFNFDRTHLERCSRAVLLMPAGKSAHLELGVMIGAKKPGYIILDGDPERYDVMYNYATAVFRTVGHFLVAVKP